MKVIIGLILSFFILSAAALPQSLPPLVSFNELTIESQKQVTCLAENIYFEAGAESINGKIAVAQVTINRVLSGLFPNTICGVVYQKHNGVCQFSWYCNKRLLRKKYQIKDTTLYNDILNLSIDLLVYRNVYQDITKGALFFHNTSVNPRWNLRKTAHIGNHIFYRYKNI
ncbi:cell wall hydrolase [bacterium]|nr:cell wall hydrolase [Candidatus Elulimicrobium humile]